MSSGDMQAEGGLGSGFGSGSSSGSISRPVHVTSELIVSHFPDDIKEMGPMHERPVVTKAAAVLFDLDGTLVESKHIWYLLLDGASKHFGYGSLQHHVWEPTFGQSMEKNRELFFPRSTQHEIDSYCDEHYIDHVSHLTILPGAVDVLTRCANMFSGNLVCVTNCPRHITSIILEKTGFATFFKHVVCSGEYVPYQSTAHKHHTTNNGTTSTTAASILAHAPDYYTMHDPDTNSPRYRLLAKPNPCILEYASQLLSIPTSQCVMIGDSKYDMMAATNAGVYASIGIGVDGGTHRVDSIQSVLTLLQ